MKSLKFLDAPVESFRICKPEYFNRHNIEEQMAKMKKMIKSPINKRKQEGSDTMRTFGVSLDDLLKRNSDESEIPQVVERIADYIKCYGIRHEGIFRINGNMKVVERLKSEFDRDGDADLEEFGDIMSVASLMKLFLRELPEPLIPRHFKTSFIQVHKDYHTDRQVCCSRMRELAEQLPRPNRQLLKFLCSFLVQISLNKDANKMNARALAIVFAPNIFRCVEGIEGFKEQSVTNNIVAMFIEEYDSILKDENEDSPFLLNCIQVQEARSNSFTGPPAMPIPYKEHKRIKERNKTPASSAEEFETISPYAEYRVGDDNRLVINEEPKGKQENHIYASVSKAQREAILNSTIDQSSDEAEPYIRSNSPSWHKPSGEPSSGNSPKLGSSPKSRIDIMEKTIKESINEHLFGHNLTSTSEESDKWDSPGEEAPPVPPKSASLLILDESGARSQKRKKRRGSKSSQENISRSNEELNDCVDGSVEGDYGKETRHKHKSEQDFDQNSARPAKRSHRSKLTAMENNQQLVVNVEDFDAPNRPVLRSDKTFMDRIEVMSDMENVDLSSIQRPSEVLSCLTVNRAPPPQKRRPPTLNKSIPSKLDLKITDLVVKTDLKSLPRKPPSPPPRASLSPSNSISTAVASKLERRKQVRSMPELAKANTDRDGEVDSEVSSSNSDDLPVTNLRPKKSDRIPIIPPLELYKLGEGIEDDPMVSPRERYDGCGFDDTMVSPRSRRATLDIRSFSTECPPSPPGDHFWHDKKQNTSPKGDATMKELNKRMQFIKKKIKEFEEKFEEENGYKPVQSQEKIPIKKYISELARTRKLIQEWRDKRNQGETNPQASTSNKESLLTTVPGTLEQSLEGLFNKLKEKREACGRPENIDDMSRDQLQDEKLAVQKALLQHENTFGRPATKRDKEVMKPLYDRYRMIKRKISSFSSKGLSDSRQSRKSSTNQKDEKKQSPERPTELDLARIAEDTMLGSPSGGDQRLTQSLPGRTTKDKERKLFDNDVSPVSPLTICIDEPEEQSGMLLEDFDSSVKDEDSLETLTSKHSDAILHQASLRELLEQQTSALKRKKKVRKKLKAFEDNFAKTTGRKVQKDDRGAHEGDYEEYKKLKARLRLLDALITKRQGNSTI